MCDAAACVPLTWFTVKFSPEIRARILLVRSLGLKDLCSKPSCDAAMSGTRTSSAGTEAKRSVPAVGRSPRRRLVIRRVRWSMDRSAVVIGVVPAFDEGRRCGLNQLITLRVAGRLASGNGRGESEACDKNSEDFSSEGQRHAP